jgi:hypothetical protein
VIDGLPRQRPDFNPGDLITVVSWETTDGAVKHELGLYGKMGYPMLSIDETPNLRENLRDVIRTGALAMVIAIDWCGDDQRWYYLLSDTRHRLGWTRSAYRFRRLST